MTSRTGNADEPGHAHGPGEGTCGECLGLVSFEVARFVQVTVIKGKLYELLTLDWAACGACGPESGMLPEEPIGYAVAPLAAVEPSGPPPRVLARSGRAGGRGTRGPTSPVPA